MGDRDYYDTEIVIEEVEEMEETIIKN